MDSIQATTFVDTTPPMSRTKQARIDIWRNEVALQTTTPDPLRPGSPSSTETPASLSSSPSRSSASIASRPRDTPESRARRLLKRIGGKLTGSKRDKNGAAGEGGVIRTRMYRDEQTAAAAAEAEDIAQPESEDRPRGGLKDKQERLERAAQLLEQGPTPAC